MTISITLIVVLIAGSTSAQRIHPQYECSDRLEEVADIAGVVNLGRSKRSADFDSEYYGNFYIAQNQADVPEQYKKYIDIDYSGNVFFHLFNGAEVFLVLPKGEELQFMAYVEEGKFRKCTTPFQNNFSFTLTQPLICSSKFTHFNDTFQFELDHKNTGSGSNNNFSRIVELDDVNVRFSNYRVLVWNPVDPGKGSVVSQGCNFQRQVFDSKHEIIRLIIRSERACECGAFISFTRMINIAFLLSERPHRNAYTLPMRTSLPVPLSSIFNVDPKAIMIGRTFILKGTLAGDPEFSIAFFIDSEEESDWKGGSIPFFIDFRYNSEGYIVAGSRMTREVWNAEMRAANPYKNGDKVDVKVYIDRDGASTIVDGKLLIKYPSEMDFTFINHIKLGNRGIFSSVSEFRLIGQALPMPFEANFPNGALQIGQSLMFFLTGQSDYWMELNDPAVPEMIEFHMKVKPEDEKVVLNSYMSNGWIDQQFLPDPFAFPNGRYVEVTLTNLIDGIRIRTDTGADYIYKHKVQNPESAYKMLRVRGADAHVLYMEVFEN